MPLPLFAFALVALPLPAPVQQSPPAPVPEVAAAPSSARPRGHLEIELTLRPRARSAAEAVTELDRMFRGARDSLRGEALEDSTLTIALRSLTPGHDSTGESFSAAVTLTLGVTALPRLSELLAVLAAAGMSEVSAVRVEPDLSPPAALETLAEALATVERVRTPRRSLGGRLGALAMLVLALRAELGR
ncbi:MAG TPA: SIMPL domain-containing protein [Gemmatimonadales bacterium]|nr:SIMPL domain-containing protein [Gemmatimonadales bacterium]